MPGMVCEKMARGKVKKLAGLAAAPCALYFLALMPRMVHRPDTGFFRKKYFAHRGLYDNAGDAPENSMEAFRRAVEAGYGMELDVHVTKDNVPVIFHDFNLKRMCGVDGVIEDYTYEELQEFTLGSSKERIPKLEELLHMVDGREPLIVEIKDERARVPSCAWFRLHHNGAVRGQLASNFLIDGGYRGAIYFCMTHLLLNFFTKPDFIAYNHRFMEEPGRRICRHLYKNPAVAWTIHSSQELEKAKDAFDVFIFERFTP